MKAKIISTISLIAVAALIGVMTMSSPLMNDITTSFTEPPEFRDIQRLEPKRDYEYPQRFAKMQAEHYGDIAPLVLHVRPDVVFTKIRELADRLAWDIVSFDADGYVLEAIAKTKLLRFRDDIVVEVRQKDNERVEVHMRSKSRLGRNDFGANAQRIRLFFDGLANSLSKP